MKQTNICFETSLGMVQAGIENYRIKSLEFIDRAIEISEISDRKQIQLVTSIREIVEGKRYRQIPMSLTGTNFQKTVWDHITKIPVGKVSTYASISKLIGEPSAYRAVANACSANPCAVLIPCHRVIRSDGTLGGYKWGLMRKRTLLDREKK